MQDGSAPFPIFILVFRLQEYSPWVKIGGTAVATLAGGRQPSREALALRVRFQGDVATAKSRQADGTTKTVRRFAKGGNEWRTWPKSLLARFFTEGCALCCIPWSRALGERSAAARTSSKLAGTYGIAGFSQVLGRRMLRIGVGREIRVPKSALGVLYEVTLGSVGHRVPFSALDRGKSSQTVRQRTPCRRGKP